MGLGVLASGRKDAAEPRKNIAASVMELITAPLVCGDENAAEVAAEFSLYQNVGRLIWAEREKMDFFRFFCRAGFEPAASCPVNASSNSIA